MSRESRSWWDRSGLVAAGLLAVGLGYGLGVFLERGWNRPAPVEMLGLNSGGADENQRVAEVAPLGDILPKAVPGFGEPQIARDSNVKTEALKAEVARVVEHLLACFPENCDALEIKARMHDWLGETEKAAETWRQCLQKNRHYVYAQVGLANLAASRGDFQNAESIAREALASDPANFQARAILAQALLNQGRPQEVVVVLEAALQQDPRSLGYYLLGQAFFQLGDYEKARDSYRKATQLWPDYAEAYHGLAQSCFRLNLDSEAAAAMEKFRSFGKPEQYSQRLRAGTKSDEELMREGAAALYAEAGRIYLLAERHRDAEVLWNRALQLDPSNRSALQSMAFVRRKEGRWRETKFYLSHLAQLEPQNPSYSLEIGRLWEGLAHWGEAEKAFRHALTIAPKNADCYAALAEFLLAHGGDQKEIVELAQEAVRLRPIAKHHALLAAAWINANDYPSAKVSLEKAVELAPESILYRQHYNEVLAKLREMQDPAAEKQQESSGLAKASGQGPVPSGGESAPSNSSSEKR